MMIALLVYHRWSTPGKNIFWLPLENPICSPSKKSFWRPWLLRILFRKSRWRRNSFQNIWTLWHNSHWCWKWNQVDKPPS